MTRGFSEKFVTKGIKREHTKKTKIELALFAEKRILDR